MESSSKTAREIYMAIKANPARARFGFGQRAVLLVQGLDSPTETRGRREGVRQVSAPVLQCEVLGQPDVEIVQEGSSSDAQRALRAFLRRSPREGTKHVLDGLQSFPKLVMILADLPQVFAGARLPGRQPHRIVSALPRSIAASNATMPAAG